MPWPPGPPIPRPLTRPPAPPAPPAMDSTRPARREGGPSTPEPTPHRHATALARSPPTRAGHAAPSAPRRPDVPARAALSPADLPRVQPPPAVAGRRPDEPTTRLPAPHRRRHQLPYPNRRPRRLAASPGPPPRPQRAGPDASAARTHRPARTKAMQRSTSRTTSALQPPCSPRGSLRCRWPATPTGAPHPCGRSGSPPAASSRRQRPCRRRTAGPAHSSTLIRHAPGQERACDGTTPQRQYQRARSRSPSWYHGSNCPRDPDSPATRRSSVGGDRLLPSWPSRCTSRRCQWQRRLNDQPARQRTAGQTRSPPCGVLPRIRTCAPAEGAPGGGCDLPHRWLYPSRIGDHGGGAGPEGLRVIEATTRS
jgi:hypothetical protein